MASLKQGYAFVLKSIKKDKSLKPIVESLKDKTYIVSGSTRGVGLSIATKLAEQGANVVITGRTVEPHPKLEGTLTSARDSIIETTKNNNCLALPCDIRKEQDISYAIQRTLYKFGSIDGVVLNASALSLKNTLQQSKKEVDLMSSININGTYLFGQAALKHMLKGHMIIVAPPIDMLYTDDWWVNHMYYSMSKFNMSLMAKFWNKEFPDVAVNTLWPRTTLDTAPVRNILGGDEMVNISRTPDIMGDAAMHIFKTDPDKCNGKNYIDDEVLASLDIDVEQYKINKQLNEKDLMPDFFC
jgi:citronellol/citronellal dehydrogenase